MVVLGLAAGIAIYFTVEPDPTAGAPGSRGGATAPADPG
jgi:hypothetical protein